MLLTILVEDTWKGIITLTWITNRRRKQLLLIYHYQVYCSLPTDCWKSLDCTSRVNINCSQSIYIYIYLYANYPSEEFINLLWCFSILYCNLFILRSSIFSEQPVSYCHPYTPTHTLLVTHIIINLLLLYDYGKSQKYV